MSPAALAAPGTRRRPTNSSPVSPAQFSLKAPWMLCTIGPCSRTLTSAKCLPSSASPSQSSTMQWPPTKASLPSMTSILRWSRSFSTPMLRRARLWKNLTLQPASRIARDRRPCRSPRAVRIEHHAHLDAGARPLREGRRHALAELAVLPQEGLEVHRLLRRADALDSTSKNAPFSSISTALPPTAVPSVRPERDGISLSMPTSHSILRSGSRWRRIDQITRPNRTITRKRTVTAVTLTAQERSIWRLSRRPASVQAATATSADAAVASRERRAPPSERRSSVPEYLGACLAYRK